MVGERLETEEYKCENLWVEFTVEVFKKGNKQKKEEKNKNKNKKNKGYKPTHRAQAVPEQLQPWKISSPAFIAEHEAIWHGVSLWSAEDLSLNFLHTPSSLFSGQVAWGAVGTAQP